MQLSREASLLDRALGTRVITRGRGRNSADDIILVKWTVCMQFQQQNARLSCVVAAVGTVDYYCTNKSNLDLQKVSTHTPNLAC